MDQPENNDFEDLESTENSYYNESLTNQITEEDETEK